MSMGKGGQSGPYGGGTSMGSWKNGLLDERYFRHIEPYAGDAGDAAKPRHFQTDLLVAIGRLDGRLARVLKHILSGTVDTV